MYKNKQNIDILVHLLKENGIHQIVISPGGTNISFVQAVQNDTFFKCYSVVDERSAIYFAIGLYLQTGEIIATSCTSAQATRNYIPGLTEAFYKRVPILAITMSKHPRFTYQEYMQAPDQTSLPCDCVKCSFSVPYIKDINDVYQSIRVINESIQRLTNGGMGPVQLNIPWLDFPLKKHVPKLRSIKTYKFEEEWDVVLTGSKIMIVIGEHRKFDKFEQEAIDCFCECYNVVIYSNNLSNFYNKYSVKANLLMATIGMNEFIKNCAPDVIITIGGQTGDYPLYTMLSQPVLQVAEHWRVSEDGKIIDTYDKLTKVFQCTEKNFFKRMINNDKSDHTYLKSWQILLENVNNKMELPFSNASIAQFLHNKIPPKSTIQFSILNSLRIWNFFDIDASIDCYSNVAAFGIDGGMSTLVGQSVASDNLCFMVIGDLAFYYDMNIIGNRHIKNNLRILLINNNGGIEFKFSRKDNDNIDKYIAAANHFKNTKGWAETCGFEYLSANTMNDFIKRSNKFLTKSEKPIIFEVFVSDIDEAKAYEIIINDNKSRTVSEHMKNGIKTVIGEEGVKYIKELLKSE